MTGCLAEPFSPDALAYAIAWVLADGHRCSARPLRAGRAVRLWSPAVMAGQYRFSRYNHVWVGPPGAASGALTTMIWLLGPN